MCQIGQLAVGKCYPIGNKMRKSLKHLSSKLKFTPKTKLGNAKLRLNLLGKEPYFPNGKIAQIGNVNKLLLILSLRHGTALWIFLQTPGGRLKLLKFFCQ